MDQPPANDSATQGQQTQPAPSSSEEPAGNRSPSNDASPDNADDVPATTVESTHGGETAASEAATPAPAPAPATDAPAAPMASSSQTTRAEVADVTTEESQKLADEQKPETTASAIAGDEEDESDDRVKEIDESGPPLTITLLLITGARHQFKMDGKYLRKRSVSVENQDPFLISVYTLKELIWREWRSEWEPRPSSPSSIRLISFGKLLDDKTPLSECRFSRDAPNVVHLTVKPQEIVDEEDAKGGKSQNGREREVSERSPGCRCIIL